MDHGESQTLYQPARAEAGRRGAADRRAADNQPRVGQLLGRYRLDAALGSGGFGTVFDAWDADLHRRVALKVLRRASERENRALLEEARALAAVHDDNVVKVFDVDEIDDHVVLAMELVEGKTLRQWRELQPTWQEILEVFLQVFDGLAAAHAAGLIHRDVKPDNIIITGPGRVVLVDFGIALRAEAHAPGAVPDGEVVSGSTLPTSVVGTPAYMSPEQIRGERIDGRSDQFSACVAMVELLTGARPFQGDDLHSTYEAIMSAQPNFPPVTGLATNVRMMLEKGLAPDPADRFLSVVQAAEVLRADLQSYRSEHQIVQLTTWFGAVGLVLSTIGALTTRPISGVAGICGCLALMSVAQVAMRLRFRLGVAQQRAWATLVVASFLPIGVLIGLYVERGVDNALSAWMPPLLWSTIVVGATVLERPALTFSVGALAAGQLIAFWAVTVGFEGRLEQNQNLGSLLFRVGGLLLVAGVGAAVTARIRDRGASSERAGAEPDTPGR